MAKGLGMDVTIMEKYDEDKQKKYFNKLAIYHTLLELNPQLQTYLGVRKAVDLAAKYDRIQKNKATGQLRGLSRGKWEIIGF